MSRTEVRWGPRFCSTAPRQEPPPLTSSVPSVGPPRPKILIVISARGFHLASFQIVGGTYRRACCCTDRTSWRPTNQAPHGRSLQCRPTDNLRVLQLRAMPDIVPVMNVVMHPAMMNAALLNCP